VSGSSTPVLAPEERIEGNVAAITVASGDGIGPEIMDATLRVLDSAGARIVPEEIRLGEAVYAEGHNSGIAPEAWESLRRTRVLLKAPISTPQGGGFKSLNVTIRKTLGLYANVRPCVAYAPFVPTAHPELDLVIVRENEEDLYAGIEHRQTDEVYQCLKLITRPGCERIVRYAFEHARTHGRHKVTCMTKDNIMKMTDGLFHRVFDEIAVEYPEVETEHMIVDIGAARLASRPDRFDVIVTPNLYGDILSDVAAELAGSIGLAGSANIGDHCAMFEAIHGSAPDIAGQGIANPSGLLLAAVMMLVHLDQPETGALIHNAWLRTVEDGFHTPDIGPAGVDVPLRRAVGTDAFATAVVQRLGFEPLQLAPVRYGRRSRPTEATRRYERLPAARKEIVGVDVFVHAAGIKPEALAGRLTSPGTHPAQSALRLQLITNRGVKVWPDGHPETFCTDHWRCRYVVADDDTAAVEHAEIVDLLHHLGNAGVDFIKTENLCTFDGLPGYALAQGQ
jgi:isocitrate dehydrogenase